MESENLKSKSETRAKMLATPKFVLKLIISVIVLNFPQLVFHEFGHSITCLAFGGNINGYYFSTYGAGVSLTIPNMPLITLAVRLSGGLIASLLLLIVYLFTKNFWVEFNIVTFTYLFFNIFSAFAEGFFNEFYMQSREVWSYVALPSFILAFIILRRKLSSQVSESDLKMKSTAISNKIFDVIIDRRLYKLGFFRTSFVYLAIGLMVQSLLYYRQNFPLVIHVTSYVFLVAVSGFFSKNTVKRFETINFWLAVLMFYTSVFSAFFSFVAPFEDTVNGLTFRFVIFTISEIVFTISILMLTVIGQRTSLRESIGVNKTFFLKDELRKRIKAIDTDEIVEILYTGRFVIDFFDKGFFNLAILWSCNVMEKTVDAIIDMIKEGPKKETLLVREDGSRLSYPRRIKMLSPEFYAKYQDEKQLTVDKLWNKVRNKIAHHNVEPTFDETIETIDIWASFVRSVPSILNDPKLISKNDS